MKKERLYFGHPINFNNTPKERQLVSKIEAEFSSCIIENPNSPVHQEGYRRFKAERQNGMLYYFEEVLPKMAGGVFLPFDDGFFGAGVYGEARFLHERHKPIFQITLHGAISILDIREARALSVEETRKRVYGDNI